MRKTAERTIADSLDVWGLSWDHTGTGQLATLARRAAGEQARKRPWTMRKLIAAYAEEKGPGCGNVRWNIEYALLAAGVDLTPKKAVRELVGDVMRAEGVRL